MDFVLPPYDKFCIYLPTEDFDLSLKLLIWINPPNVISDDFLTFIGQINLQHIAAFQSLVNKHTGNNERSIFFMVDERSIDEHGMVKCLLTGGIDLHINYYDTDNSLTVFSGMPIRDNYAIPSISFSPKKGLYRTDTDEMIHSAYNAVFAIMPYLHKKEGLADYWMEIPDYLEFYYRVGLQNAIQYAHLYDKLLKRRWSTDIPIAVLNSQLDEQQAEEKQDRTADLLRIVVENQHTLSDQVNEVLKQQTKAPVQQMNQLAQGISAAPDYRCINCQGQIYTFTSRQSQIIEILFASYQNGTPDVGQDYLLETLNIDSTRLRDVFRSSDAWGTLVIKGTKRGTYRLNI